MPGASGEKYEDREDLQSSRQHIQDQDQLGQDTVGSKITGRANGLKARSYIVKTCKYSGYIGGYTKSINGDNDKTDYDDHHVGSQIGIYVIQYFFSYYTVVVSDNLYFSGMDNLQDVPAQILQQEEKTSYLKSSSGTAGTGPHKHKA